MIPPYLFHIQLIMGYYGGIFFASKSKIALFSRLFFLTLTDSQRPIFLSKTDDSSLLVLEVYLEKSEIDAIGAALAEISNLIRWWPSPMSHFACELLYGFRYTGFMRKDYHIPFRFRRGSLTASNHGLG